MWKLFEIFNYNIIFPRNRLETKSNTVKQPTAGGDHGFSDNVAMELGEVDNGEYASVIERPVQTGYQGLDVSQMEKEHDYIWASGKQI